MNSDDLSLVTSRMLLSGQVTADGTGYVPVTVAVRLRHPRWRARRASIHCIHHIHGKLANSVTD